MPTNQRFASYFPSFDNLSATQSHQTTRKKSNSDASMATLFAGSIINENATLLCCLTGTGVIGNLVTFGLSILFQARVSVYLAAACAVAHGLFLLIAWKWIRLPLSVIVVGAGGAELVLIHGQFEFQFESSDLFLIGDLVNQALEWVAIALTLIPTAMGYINIVAGGYMLLIASTAVLCGRARIAPTNESNNYYIPYYLPYGLGRGGGRRGDGRGGGKGGRNRVVPSTAPLLDMKI